MRKVRIEHDGEKAYNVKITDAKTGEPIESVRALEWRASVDAPATATLEVWLPKVDVTVDANIIEKCPYCGHEREQDDNKQDGIEVKRMFPTQE